MTCKHFETLARGLRFAHPGLQYDRALGAWIDAVMEVADVYEEFDPNFDRQRFLTACQPKD